MRKKLSHKGSFVGDRTFITRKMGKGGCGILVIFIFLSQMPLQILGDLGENFTASLQNTPTISAVTNNSYASSPRNGPQETTFPSSDTSLGVTKNMTPFPTSPIYNTTTIITSSSAFPPPTYSESNYILLQDQSVPPTVPEIPENDPEAEDLENGSILESVGVVGKSARLHCPISLYGRSYLSPTNSSGQTPSLGYTNPNRGHIHYVRFVKVLPGRGDKVKFTNLFTHVIIPPIPGHVISAGRRSESLLAGGTRKNSGTLAGRADFRIPYHTFYDNVVEGGSSNSSGEQRFQEQSLEYETSPYLEIKNLTLEDAGTYVCLPKLRNHLSEQGQRINLRVMVPPSTPRINYTNDVGVYEGEFLYVNCYSTMAKPVANLIWRKSGKLLDGSLQMYGNLTNDDNVTFSSWNVLRIKASREDLRNMYSCQATNNYSNDKIDTTSFKLNLYVRPMRPVIENVEKILVEGTELEIVCKVKGSNPMPTVFWTLQKGQSILSMNGTYNTIIDNTGAYDVVNILNLRLNRTLDKAVLACNTTNPVMDRNGEPHLITNFTLSVKYPPQTVYLSHGEIKLTNGTVQFEEIICDSSANPPANVKWTLEGYGQVLSRKNILVAHPDILLKYGGGKTDLTLTCEAFNEFGTARNNVSIQIRYKPRCLVDNTVLYILSNSSVEIECPLEASPPVFNFKWIKEELEEYYYLTNKRSNHISQLTDTHVSNTLVRTKTSHSSKSDQTGKIYRINATANADDKFGTYLCSGSNTVGASDRQCAIHVFSADPPKPPKNCSLEQSNVTIIIRCEAPTHLPTPQRYVLQGKLKEDKTYKNISVANEPYFNLTYPSISPATIYSFRVLSVNNIGISLSYEGSNGDSSTEMTIRTSELKGSQSLNLQSLTWIIIISVLIVMLVIVSVLVTYTFLKHKNPKKPRNLMLNGTNIYGDFLNMHGDRDMLTNGSTIYGQKMNGYQHDNYTDIRLIDSPAIMAHDLQHKPMNYTLCLSSVNKSPIIYKNLIPVPKINSTKLSNQNLIYADVETINNYATKACGHIPHNDYSTPVPATHNFIGNGSSPNKYLSAGLRVGREDQPDKRGHDRVVYSSVMIPIKPVDRYALGDSNNNRNSYPNSTSGLKCQSLQQDLGNGGRVKSQQPDCRKTEAIAVSKPKITENPLKHSFYLPKRVESTSDYQKQNGAKVGGSQGKVRTAGSQQIFSVTTPQLELSNPSSTNTSSPIMSESKSSSGGSPFAEEDSSESSEKMNISAIV